MRLFLLCLLGILVGIGIAFIEPKYVWTVPVLVLVGLAFIGRPLWIITLLLAILPFRIVWRAGGIEPLELAYSLTFLFLLVRVLLKQGFVPAPYQEKADFRSPMRIPLVLFLILAASSAVTAFLRGVPFGFWASDLNMILFFAFYFVIIGHVRDPRYFDRLLIILSLVTLVAVIYRSYPAVRARGFAITLYGEPVIKVAGASAFGLMIFLIFSSILLLMKEKGAKKLFFVALCLLFGIHQIIATVRSRWLGGIAALMVIFLVSLPPQKAQFRRILFSLILGVTLLLTASFTIPALSENPALVFMQSIQKRFATVFKGREDLTTEARLVEWEAAMQKIRHHPWLGNGLGTEITFVDTSLYKPTSVTLRYIHNSYIFYLLNMGTVGLLVFLWLCFSFVGYGLRVFRSIENDYYKGMALGFWASFVAMVVVGFAGASLNDPALSIWTGFFMGAMTVMDQKKHLLKETHVSA